jgi:hypothetical protein
MALIILLTLLIGLFAIAFVTKRRFGVLGLGLTAGLVLSRELTSEMAGLLQYIDFPVGSLSYTALGTSILVLLPALVLLISGPKYQDKRLAAVGASLFALFGLTLLLTPLGAFLVSSNPDLQPILSSWAVNGATITTAAVIAAVIDMTHAQGKSLPGKKSKH